MSRGIRSTGKAFAVAVAFVLTACGRDAQNSAEPLENPDQASATACRQYRELIMDAKAGKISSDDYWRGFEEVRKKAAESQVRMIRESGDGMDTAVRSRDPKQVANALKKFGDACGSVGQ